VPISEQGACGVGLADTTWTGSSIVAAWDREDCNRVDAAVIDPHGVALRPETTLYASIDWPQNPQVVWTGSEAAVVWRNLGYGNVFMARLDPLGAPVSGPTTILRGSGSQSVVWTGSKYALFWFQNHDLIYTRLGEAGHAFGDTVLETVPSGIMYGPSLVWTGTSYGVVYYNGSDLVLTTAKGNGNRAKDRIITSTQYALNTAIAWNGTEIAVVWSDLRDGYVALYFARFDAHGRRKGPDVRLTDDQARFPSGPRLAWNGTEYGLAWEDDRDGNWEVYFTRIDSTGTRLGGDLRVTSDRSTSTPMRLLWMGDAYGIVLIADPQLNLRRYPYFVRIGCR